MKEDVLEKMYNSFDLNGTQQMDWRAFLYLLTVGIRPDLDYEEQLR